MKKLLPIILLTLSSLAGAINEEDTFTRVNDNDMCMIQLGHASEEFKSSIYGIEFSIPDTEEKTRNFIDESAKSLKWVSTDGWKSDKQNYEIYNPDKVPFHYQVFKLDKNAQNIYAYVIIGKSGGCIVYTPKSSVILPLLFKKKT